MKRTMSIVFIACLVFSLAISIQSASAAERVRLPYLSHGGGWFCGIAVTNLSGTALTLTLDLVTSEGKNNSLFFQYRTVLPEIDPYAILVGPIVGTGGLYGTSLPGPASTDGSKSFWIELWHTGTQDFAATSFIASLDIPGYAYETWFSEVHSNTFGEYEPPEFNYEMVKTDPYLPWDWHVRFPGP